MNKTITSLAALALGPDPRSPRPARVKGDAQRSRPGGSSDRLLTAVVGKRPG